MIEFAHGILDGFLLTNTLWLYFYIRRKQVPNSDSKMKMKIPRFFTMPNADKKKPKVHDDLHDWAKENDRKLDN